MLAEAGMNRYSPMTRSAGIGLTRQNRQFQKWGFLLNCSLVPVLWQLTQNIGVKFSIRESGSV